VCSDIFFPFLDSYVWLQAVTRYIKGVLRKEAGPEVQETKPKKVKMEYTIRDVVKQHYSSRVDQEIPFKSTDKEYIGSYQRAVTTVLNEMTEEDLEEVEKVLDLWNKKGAPSDLQLKYVLTFAFFDYHVF
jgi:hypothetical protein